MLLAFGILLMHAGAGSIARRTLVLLTIGFSAMSLADIVWAMAKVTGTYLPGGLSDAMYLSCYAWLIAAAREQLRGAPAVRPEASADERRPHAGHAVRRDAGLLPGARVRRTQFGREPGDRDDRDHLPADASRHAAPGRDVAR